MREYSFGDGPISEDFFRQRISGRSNADICGDLFPEWTAEQGIAFSAYKEQAFRDRAADRLAALKMPGLDTLIAWVDDHGLQKAAVTNAPRANAEQMLSAIGRQQWFDTLVIGDECSAAKPDPEPYRAAMRTLGVTPAECVAFEDSPSGARAAVAAGVHTIGVLSTQPAALLVAAGCSTLIVDFDDVALWEDLTKLTDRGDALKAASVADS